MERIRSIFRWIRLFNRTRSNEANVAVDPTSIGYRHVPMPAFGSKEPTKVRVLAKKNASPRKHTATSSSGRANNPLKKRENDDGNTDACEAK